MTFWKDFINRGYTNAEPSNVCSCAEVISCGGMDNVSLIPVPSGGFGETARLQTAGQIDKMEFSLDFRRNHLKRRSFLGLRPHILGWIFLLFLRNKRKEKEYREATKCRYSGILTKVYEKGSFIADDILQAKILSISIYRKSPFLEVLNKTAWLQQNIILFPIFLLAKPIKI